MNKQQLANKIWASANKMRSKIDANEYKDYILGLIFYKFLSDNEVNYILKDMKGASDEEKQAALESLVENYEDPTPRMLLTIAKTILVTLLNTKICSPHGCYPIANSRFPTLA